ncbi:hypothetical protein TcG_09522 [Trypanosoma cruzi]|nr:hypothetical protein TcBrA4_0032790 [Trypanosoma cruzi]RNF09990.1 hypothetical protein TcG_09522 [Trypanosoma cruzi]
MPQRTGGSASLVAFIRQLAGRSRRSGGTGEAEEAPHGETASRHGPPRAAEGRPGRSRGKDRCRAPGPRLRAGSARARVQNSRDRRSSLARVIALKRGAAFVTAMAPERVSNKPRARARFVFPD